MTRTIGGHIMDGYDVAGSYQPHFNWQASRDAGDELAAFKATQGTGFVDTWLAKNRAATEQLGFRYRGIYAWITPGVSIAAQLAHFVAVVGDLHLGEFVQLDEEQSPLTLDECVQACELFSARYPGRVAHYGGASFDGFGHVHPRLRLWPWWLAAYRATIPSEVFPPTIWQWGGSHVDGIVKDVDSNQIIDRAQLETLAGYVHPDPVHTGGKDMTIFVQLDPAVFPNPQAHDPVFVANVVTSAWVRTPAELAVKKLAIGWAADTPNHLVSTYADLLVWGDIVSDLPPGWTTAGPPA